MSANAKRKPEFEHRPGDPPHRLTRTRRLTIKEADRNRALREAVLKDFSPAPGSRAAASVAVRKLLEQLREERKRQGLSLSQLASLVGIDKAALSRLENGKQPNPTLETILRYAKAIGKQIEWRFVDATS